MESAINERPRAIRCPCCFCPFTSPSRLLLEQHLQAYHPKRGSSSKTLIVNQDIMARNQSLRSQQNIYTGVRVPPPPKNYNRGCSDYDGIPTTKGSPAWPENNYRNKFNFEREHSVSDEGVGSLNLKSFSRDTKIGFKPENPDKNAYASMHYYCSKNWRTHNNIAKSLLADSDLEFECDSTNDSAYSNYTFSSGITPQRATWETSCSYEEDHNHSLKLLYDSMLTRNEYKSHIGDYQEKEYQKVVSALLADQSEESTTSSRDSSYSA